MRYLADWWLKPAASLLRDSHAPLADVAYRVEFASTRGFARASQTTSHQTPAAFRGATRTPRRPAEPGGAAARVT